MQFDGAMTLTSAGRRHVEELRDRYPPDGFPGELSWPEVHIAPIATGGRVVEDEELFPTIHTSVRKTLGVDMEGAAIGAVAAIEDVDHCIVVKGVQDHADREKDDRYRAYAIETSYRFLIAFLRRHLPPKKRAPFILPQLPMGNFTGRNRETRALERILLHDGTARLCTIAGLSGTAGIGKSALAVHFSVVHRDAFPAGVIGLRVDGKELDAIAREFVRIAGEDVDPDDERDATVLMQSVFRDREALLIFDNAELDGDPEIGPRWSMRGDRYDT